MTVPGRIVDGATPMRVLSIDALEGVARCAAPDGQEAIVRIEVIEPLRPGHSVLVLDGVAVALVDASA